MISCGKWRLIKELSCTPTSKLYFAEKENTLEKAMVKIIDYQDIGQSKEEEIKEIANLSHPRLSSIIEYGLDTLITNECESTEVYLSIASDVVSGKKLIDLISLTGPFSEEMARYYFYQLCDAIGHLSQNGTKQYDLSYNNLFLDEEYNLIVGDPTGKVFEEYLWDIRHIGVTQAPEVYGSMSYSETSDNKKISLDSCHLFSAGVLLFTMVTGKYPFKNPDKNDSYYKYLILLKPELFWRKHLKEHSQGLQALSLEIKEFINLLLSFNPLERPSLDELKELEWYTGQVPTHDEIIQEIDKRISIVNPVIDQIGKDTPDIEDVSDIILSFLSRIELYEYEENLDKVRTCECYIPELKKFTQFFSTSDVETLYKTLLVFIQHFAIQASFSYEHYSLTFTPPRENREDERPAFHTVRILEVKDGLYCVEVINTGGPELIPREVYQILKEFFGGYVNATEPT
ncbi:unnamed protein product [Moneuplotes crassus]|uniref:non-specific serine/threonine protein kinase n=1 Tax=Euplotes crassus TaxID=5936 RepID=A0AAD1Y5X6_EUPCR|nr:unnamed protein product [Moneuplotes crassus]